MSEKKTLGIGKGTPGPGRPKGLVNKRTAMAREAIALFVEDNVPRLQSWLDDIARTEGPLAAFNCVERIIEYHVPKLQRSDVTVSGGLTINLVNEEADL